MEGSAKKQKGCKDEVGMGLPLNSANHGFDEEELTTAQRRIHCNVRKFDF